MGAARQKRVLAAKQLLLLVGAAARRHWPDKTALRNGLPPLPSHGLPAAHHVGGAPLASMRTHLGCANDLPQVDVHPCVALHHVTIVCFAILELHQLQESWRSNSLVVGK